MIMPIATRREFKRFLPRPKCSERTSTVSIIKALNTENLKPINTVKRKTKIREISGEKRVTPLKIVLIKE